jgi:hypothetical protein
MIIVVMMIKSDYDHSSDDYDKALFWCRGIKECDYSYHTYDNNDSDTLPYYKCSSNHQQILSNYMTQD